MTEHDNAAEQPAVVRKQDFTADGPVKVHATIGSGRIEVILAEQDTVQVELREAAAGADPLSNSLNSLLSWVGDQFPQVADAVGLESEGGAGASAAEAVRQSRVDMTGVRLVVRTPKNLPLRNVAIAVTIRAPRGSDLELRSAAGDIAVTGTAGRLEAASRSGNVSAEDVTGSAVAHTGSGDIRLGRCADRLHSRGGSGDIEVSAIEGASTVATGTGNVRLGTVSAALLVRSGSGDLTVAEAVRDELELMTGSGDVRVGIRSGVTAEVTLSSGSGTVHSDLEVADSPPETEAALSVRGRSGTGDVVVGSQG